jgi:uncharacterized zinc-type alcohol dehydrogenase-like protein
MADTILAWAQHTPRTPLEATERPFPEPPDGYDVDIAVAHCSVCHSDVHLLDGDWGEVPRPLIPGHEVVGRVMARGPLAVVQPETWVGVGWQAGACTRCRACRTGRSQLCTDGKVRTCVGRPGGFATHLRVDSRWAFPLPESLDKRSAAPLLCAGLTVFSPLERFQVGADTRVGVVGLGGLGHMAVRFASALGAQVLAFDPDLSKKSLAHTLGAHDLLDTNGPLPSRVVDLLLVTTHANLPWNDWLKVLDLEGTLCLLGVPSAPVTLSVDPLLDEQKRVTGSVVGSPDTMRKMLTVAAEKGITPITERMPMHHVNDAIARVREGKARLRVVLDVT